MKTRPDDFLKLNSEPKDFLGGILNLEPEGKTVVVVYVDGYKKEYYGIQKPHQYITKVLQNPAVKTAFVKD